MPNLSNRLTLLREKQGWSKAETARRLGLKAPSTYGNWEYGIREPDLEMVTQIATLY
ncbi:helix-turn-helix transcriptional regulator, partial [Listeria monocytogenes]|nr:helix-turn-helix transcriptional regulator [Listeria monocytogenes]